MGFLITLNSEESIGGLLTSFGGFVLGGPPLAL